jgi:hypothetical protein
MQEVKWTLRSGTLYQVPTMPEEEEDGMRRIPVDTQEGAVKKVP